MSRHTLSNLRVRPNLLSENYQQEMLRCSVFELRNIYERNPNLSAPGLSPERQQEWRESLFWGDSPPPPVETSWAEHLAGRLSDAVRELEEWPTLEAAFECLLIARQLYWTRSDGPARKEAEDWDRRVCAVLARDEFRHTPDMIDQRLESILGHKLVGPPRPTVPFAEPVSRPAVVIVSPQPPVLTPAPTSIKVAAVPELPPVPEAQPGLSVLPPPLVPLAPPTRTAEIPPTNPTNSAEVRSPPVAPPKPITTLTVPDPSLERLVQRWSTLPDHVKQCVMMMLDASDATQNTNIE